MATLTNNVAISFPTPTGAWLVPTHFAVLAGRTAVIQSSTAMITGTLSTVSAPADGDTVEFASGQLTVTLTGDELTERTWKVMLGGVRSNATISLHTGSPTAANELTGNGYARKSTSSSNWTVA